MKSSRFFTLVAFFASASLAWPQTQPQFITGQAARGVIGQYSFDLGTMGASSQILGGVGAIAWANGTLFAADDNVLGAVPNNHRVMMFNTNQIPAPEADVSTFGGFDTYCNICGFPAYNVLGEPDYSTVNPGRSASAMNEPTAVATNGTILAVADTNNNRVMIWKSIPTTPNAPADLVLGQPDLNTFQTPNTVNASTLRGPQGVWIQNGKLFVSDTMNYRVLIWNSIPTTNNQPADVVLGQKDFTSVYQPPVAANLYPSTNASEMLDPVGVSSDGTHLFVADLGFNRILIWNEIPTQNDQPADVEIGQPDMTTSIPDNTTTGLCASTTISGVVTYPSECAATIQFPRFALADNTGRLFVADGGNDRVLIFNQIPTANGASADIALGQPDMFTDVVTSASISIISTVIDNTGSVDTIANPSGLAWDGTNLYVSDPWDERVLIYTPADIQLAEKSTLNAASLAIRQEGFAVLQLLGSIVAGDTVTITIQSATYTYTIKSTDTLDTITTALINLINTSNSGAGDPYVIALTGSVPDTVYLNSRATNLDADTITMSATTSDPTNITATASSLASNGYLTGGTSATVAPGTLIQISNPATPGVPTLSDYTASADTSSGKGLPTTLGGVQVSIDGFPSPILSVSPTAVISQIPFNFTEKNSSSVYVRTVHADGTVTVTTASPVYLAPANPGLFASPNYPEPRPVFNAMHQATNPSATVSIDGSVNAGDVATITVNGTAYNYTVVAADTLATIAQNLANVINAGPDPYVVASVGGAFTRVVLTARQPAPVGAGITIAGSASSTADVTITAYQSATCCTDNDGQPVTAQDPAQPNETITFYATGVGQVTDPNTSSAENYAVAGVPYNGPQPNSATSFVTTTVNGETGQTISAGLVPGGIGMYGIQVIMPGDLTPNVNTPVYVAQNAFISNIVTIPVGPAGGLLTANPNPILAGPGATTGTTTLSWNVPQSAVEIHVGSPGGTLFGAGGSTGSGTTGNWVTNGMTFYLQDATQGTTTSPNNTIATVTAQVKPIGGTLAGSPNPILVPAGTTGPQATTLNWYAPNSTTVEVHVGSPGGTLFVTGGSQGAATTGLWVTDGMTFYLQDATNGNSTSSSNTLAVATVHIQNQPSTATLTAGPNPIVVSPGSTLGQTTLSWTVPGATLTEVHLGSGTGPLFAAVNGPTGSATTGNWVTDGMTFYLQDLINGPGGPSITVAALVAHLETGGTLTLSPNPIPVSGGQDGTTTITWNAPFATAVEIHLGSPSGPLFAGGGSTGSATTGPWVTDGMVFYLQDASNGNATSPSNTLATVTANLALNMPSINGSDPHPFAPWPR
ncbi:MAG TPA: hypothetical protein VHZ07_12680 [Bryobacteraceae bacterium]|nr:hypothetical protein [Bryobacteraceae bacterium]